MKIPDGYNTNTHTHTHKKHTKKKKKELDQKLQQRQHAYQLINTHEIMFQPPCASFINPQHTCTRGL